MALHHSHNTTKSGMTLVELLIAIGLVTLIFGGLIGTFQFMVALVGSSKAEAGGLALANEKMEYIRSLAYNDVGTISGIPNGPIPQNSTTTLNGITYSERVLIEYFDDAQDGTGALDVNGIVSDYKRAKVEYSWDFRGETKTISLISNIVPRGIETTVGGGTLTVNVFDAGVQPVSGAAVRLYNNTGSTTIDTTRNTNANGVAMFSGAPALSGYEITVTKTDFSTDQTYTATTSNPNPITAPVAVLEAEVSTMNFQIDELSDLTVVTQGAPTVASFEDDFTDSSKIASVSDAQVASGEVLLAGAPGSFSSQGTVYSAAITPAVVDSWGALSFSGRVPSGTSLTVHIYDATGSTTPVLISDSDLPGNSTGFAPGSVDLMALDPATYQSLVLRGTLSSSDTATTSALLGWNVSYTISAPALAHIPFSLQGSKVIGTDVSSTPIYKFEDSFTTDSTGSVDIHDLEWDIYDVTVDAATYDLAEACGNVPYALDPGVDEILTLTLVPNAAHTIRVRVEDGSGAPIPHADITVSRSGFSEEKASSACGQAFFDSGLSAQVDYAVSIEASGYVDQTITELPIDGDATLTVIMTSI